MTFQGVRMSHLKHLMRKSLPLFVAVAALPATALADLSAVPDSLELVRGEKARIQILGAESRLRLRNSDDDVVEA